MKYLGLLALLAFALSQVIASAVFNQSIRWIDPPFQITGLTHPTRNKQVALGANCPEGLKCSGNVSVWLCLSSFLHRWLAEWPFVSGCWWPVAHHPPHRQCTPDMPSHVRHLVSRQSKEEAFLVNKIQNNACFVIRCDTFALLFLLLVATGVLCRRTCKQNTTNPHPCSPTAAQRPDRPANNSKSYWYDTTVPLDCCIELPCRPSKDKTLSDSTPSYCMHVYSPYCKRAKQALAAQGAKCDIVELVRDAAQPHLLLYLFDQVGSLRRGKRDDELSIYS